MQQYIIMQGPSVGINEVEMEDGSDAEATEYGNAAASITRCANVSSLIESMEI